MTTLRCDVTWGFFNDVLVSSPLVYPGTPLSFAWSNVDFRSIQNSYLADPTVLPGNTAIDLMLRLLVSTGTLGANGTYDTLERGVGLGIPEGLIDVDSFTRLQTSSQTFDFDANQRVFFFLTQPEPAKDFIDLELCRPFGLYLAVGNDGRIRCNRPRHPQKFYIGASNRIVAIRTPGLSLDVRSPSIPIGVYTGPELAALVSGALPAHLTNCCIYDSSAHKFKLTYQFGIFADYSIDTSAKNNIWNTLGFTSDKTISGLVAADETRGEFTGASISEDDMWDVHVIDNLEERIASVSFHYDYDSLRENFTSFTRFTDEESSQMRGTAAFYDYRIESRGLISGISNGHVGNAWLDSFEDSPFGCSPTRRRTSSQWTVTANTWSALYAKALLDRYRQPPLKFQARLKWKWNALEIGDVVRVNYSIPGVLMDPERNKEVIESRLFEIVEIHPNPEGSIDATFLGHRWVNY